MSISTVRCRMSTERDGDSICTIAVFPLVCEGRYTDRRNCPFWSVSRQLAKE